MAAPSGAMNLMLNEEHLAEVLPERMRKDVVFTRHEIPIGPGKSQSVAQSYYTPRVFLWAVSRWLESVPFDADIRALRRALPIALSDPQTFHGYLAVPEAFAETYEDELNKLERHRADIDSLKRVLARESFPMRCWRRVRLWLHNW